MRAWREAADAGHPAAAFNVGWLLDKHHGRPAEAEVWYRRSAARGSPEAMAKLGRLAQAQGDAAAAEAWFRQAAALGHEPAVQGLAGLLGQRGRPRRFWRRRAG
jgi:TPR repeat protein